MTTVTRKDSTSSMTSSVISDVGAKPTHALMETKGYYFVIRRTWFGVAVKSRNIKIGEKATFKDDGKGDEGECESQQTVLETGDKIFDNDIENHNGKLSRLPVKKTTQQKNSITPGRIRHSLQRMPTSEYISMPSTSDTQPNAKYQISEKSGAKRKRTTSATTPILRKSQKVMNQALTITSIAKPEYYIQALIMHEKYNLLENDELVMWKLFQYIGDYNQVWSYCSKSLKKVQPESMISEVVIDNNQEIIGDIYRYYDEKQFNYCYYLKTLITHESNPSLSFIEVLANGVPMKALVDTDSTISIISTTSFQRIRHLPPVKYRSTTCRTANSTELQTIGEVALKIKINQFVTTVTVQIAEPICTDLILGMDSISLNNVSINGGQQRIIISTRRGTNFRNVLISVYSLIQILFLHYISCIFYGKYCQSPNCPEASDPELGEQ
ncbi:unnamed protein product [Didymodactylos carnosus]|uniref:Peptidase A2 domain-containing protein n=3 Tax=Didymodactylos carnosus TaxID=1234261 RepID=A0A813Y5I6_9BILA|nr:unnamed protein product [Didymodactylos carnosus]CAF3663430.1 unnamed protein product [Didymodactylos carnosus]